LLENSQVAIAEQVFLPGFKFKTALARHVSQRDRAKVGQTGFRTHRSKLRIIDHDLVGGKLIRPGFNGRKVKIEPRLCVLVRITRNWRHTSILRLDPRLPAPGIARARLVDESVTPRNFAFSEP